MPGQTRMNTRQLIIGNWENSDEADTEDHMKEIAPFLSH
jgi:hypothetical protein